MWAGRLYDSPLLLPGAPPPSAAAFALHRRRLARLRPRLRLAHRHPPPRHPDEGRTCPEATLLPRRPFGTEEPGPQRQDPRAPRPPSPARPLSPATVACP